VLRRPVAVLTAAYALGIVGGRYFPVSQQCLYGVGICVLTAVMVCVFAHRVAVGTAMVVLLAAVLGVLAYVPFHTLPASVKQLDDWLHKPVVVEGVVKHVEPRMSGALRLTLHYDSIEMPEDQCLVSGLVLITLKNPF